MFYPRQRLSAIAVLLLSCIAVSISRTVPTVRLGSKADIQNVCMPY